MDNVYQCHNCTYKEALTINCDIIKRVVKKDGTLRITVVHSSYTVCTVYFNDCIVVNQNSL